MRNVILLAICTLLWPSFLTAQSTTNLDDLVSHIMTTMPPRDSEAYLAPSASVQADLERAAKQVLSTNRCQNLRLPNDLRDIYSTVSVEEADGERYCVLLETADADLDGVVDRGWGSLIVNMAPRSNVHVQIVHPQADYRTEWQGLHLFQETGAVSLMLAGAHRYANSAASDCQSNYRISDTAHLDRGLVQAATHSLQKEAHNDPYVVLQFHGMSVTTCPDVDVYLTQGVTTPPDGNSAAAVLRDALQAHQPGWSIVLPGEQSTCWLNGTQNVQGRLLNGVPQEDVCELQAGGDSGHFVHIEQVSTVRDPQYYDSWVAALRQAFSTDLASLSYPEAGPPAPADFRQPGHGVDCETFADSPRSITELERLYRMFVLNWQVLRRPPQAMAYLERLTAMDPTAPQTLQAATTVGAQPQSSTAIPETTPRQITLTQSYPNPWQPGQGTATIRFFLPREQSVSLTLYNSNGQRVRQLAQATHSAGWHQLSWSGRSDRGHPVASGIYYYRLETSTEVHQKRLIVLPSQN